MEVAERGDIGGVRALLAEGDIDNQDICHSISAAFMKNESSAAAYLLDVLLKDRMAADAPSSIIHLFMLAFRAEKSSPAFIEALSMVVETLSRPLLDKVLDLAKKHVELAENAVDDFYRYYGSSPPCEWAEDPTIYHDELEEATMIAALLENGAKKRLRPESEASE